MKRGKSGRSLSAYTIQSDNEENPFTYAVSRPVGIVITTVTDTVQGLMALTSFGFSMHGHGCNSKQSHGVPLWAIRR